MFLFGETVLMFLFGKLFPKISARYAIYRNLKPGTHKKKKRTTLIVLFAPQAGLEPATL